MFKNNACFKKVSDQIKYFRLGPFAKKYYIISKEDVAFINSEKEKFLNILVIGYSVIGPILIHRYSSSVIVTFAICIYCLNRFALIRSIDTLLREKIFENDPAWGFRQYFTQIAKEKKWNFLRTVLFASIGFNFFTAVIFYERNTSNTLPIISSIITLGYSSVTAYLMYLKWKDKL